MVRYLTLLYSTMLCQERMRIRKKDEEASEQGDLNRSDGNHRSDGLTRKKEGGIMGRSREA